MDYTAFLTNLLQTAGQTALEYFGNVSSTTKPRDNNQVLTQADLDIGKQLVAAVRTAYPDYNVIDEEAGVIDMGSRYTWVIDPIEATANFANGTPDWGIMVGLLQNDIPIAGGIIAPQHNELYLAKRGSGATCNGKPIHVSGATELSKTSVSFSLGGHQDDPVRTQRECRQLAGVLLAARNMRNSDCEAVDSMYVARGSYGGRINMTSKIWDNVAPQCIATEAGALWASVDGAPLDYTHPLQKTAQNYAFCVASPALHRKLLTVLAEHV